MNLTLTQSIDNSLPLADQLEGTWRAMHGKLQRRARLLCKGDKHRADDLLSDTALKVFLYVQRTPERVQNLGGFLFLALNHAFLDNTRRQGRESRYMDRDCMVEDEYLPESVSLAPSPEQLLEYQQAVLQLEALHEQLTPEQRVLFELKFELDQPYPQIAATLGINEALARKRVELLRKKLRKQLNTPPKPVHKRPAMTFMGQSTPFPASPSPTHP